MSVFNKTLNQQVAHCVLLDIQWSIHLFYIEFWCQSKRNSIWTLIYFINYFYLQITNKSVGTFVKWINNNTVSDDVKAWLVWKRVLQPTRVETFNHCNVWVIWDDKTSRLAIVVHRVLEHTWWAATISVKYTSLTIIWWIFTYIKNIQKDNLKKNLILKLF